MKNRVVGGTGPTHIKPLKEDKAVEVGAELLGDLFIYAAASTVLLLEYWRSSRKEALIDVEQDRDIDILQKELNEVKQTLHILNDRILLVEQSLPKVKNDTKKG